MKKIIILLFVLANTVNLKAQGFSYGIKGGYNYSTIRAKNLNNIDGQDGFHAGVFANLSAILIQVQPELLFSQRGYEIENGNDIRMNYLEAPVLLKVKVFPFVTVDAGPQFSYLINTKELSDNIVNPGMPSFKDTDLSAVIGTSLNVWKLGASLRYIHGFSELESTNNSKNSMFQLSLQIKL